MEFNVMHCQNWLDNFTKTIIEKKDYLNELDSPIGDGDHGSNMARGVLEYRKLMETKPPQTISDTLKLLAMAMISKVGGSSGPLYGTAFLAMSKVMDGVEKLTTLEEMSKILTEGINGIQMRGKGVYEDKTMLDVWIPVVDHLKEGRLDSTVIEQAKNSTREFIAKKGRASYLGERSIGHIDPGAASSAYLFEELFTII
jgi:dihydroxyacetone kinase-like protein